MVIRLCMIREELGIARTHLVVKPAPTERNRDREGADITTYLITWVCYGAWLPGESGAVPRTQNRFGAPLPEASPNRERQSRKRMEQPPYRLDVVRRDVVLESLQEVCS